VSYACRECGFEVYVPIIESDLTVLGLYDDDRFPGRCILALREHAEHLDEVAPDLASLLLTKAVTVGRALRNLGFGDRVNYAVLGNARPHVHMHIIPRGGASDVLPDRPPWEHPRKAGPLDPSLRAATVVRLRETLADF